MLGIYEIINESMHETAKSFGEALKIYWPQTEGGTSDPPERNLSMRFASSLLNRGYHLFGEANHSVRKNARMDVLAISKDRQHYVVAEFKVYSRGGGISKSSEDVERIMDFTLNNYKSPERVGKDRIETINFCKDRIGVVGGLLETSDRNPPNMDKSKKHRDLSDRIKALGGSVEAPIFITNLTSSQGAYWLAYAILP